MTTVAQAGAQAPAAGPGPITEPGIYDMDNETYHSHRYALSSSGARKLIESSPAHFRYEQDHPQPVKKVWDIGNAAHRLVLGNGPELRLVDYERWDTKVAKAEVAEARAEGAVPLKRAEYEQVHEMAAALRQHPVASLLFDPEHGTPERSLFWRDDRTGVMRRARLDWLPNPRPGRRLIIPDYKTCVSAHPERLQRVIDDLGYHQQDDTYRSGCHALGIADETAAFVFVCQEKTAPYVITVIEVNAAARRIGAARNRRALEIFAHCTATGYWPGYSDDVVPVALPPWAETRDTLEYL